MKKKKEKQARYGTRRNVLIENDLCFFFQAEDGIRDGRVTGVQTCALPIWSPDLVADLELRAEQQVQPGRLHQRRLRPDDAGLRQPHGRAATGRERPGDRKSVV